MTNTKYQIVLFNTSNNNILTYSPTFSNELKLAIDKDINTDYDYSRESYYSLIEKGQEAIQGILDIAKEGQHPRAYEVAGQLIGQVGQTVDKLQDLQKKLKDLKEVPNKTNANIKNNKSVNISMIISVSF